MQRMLQHVEHKVQQHMQVARTPLALKALHGC